MSYHLAQLNVARLAYALDDPRIKDFVDGLERINRLAERSDGFVWRLQSDSGNATDVVHPWSADPFALVNMSVWESMEQLKRYVFGSGHMEFYQRRAEWFEKPAQAHHVMWWIPQGHIPTLEEARGRLEHYRLHGATPYAFQWAGAPHPAPL